LGNDEFAVNWDAAERALVVNLASQLEEIDDLDNPSFRRLFPTAYPQDPERDAGFQIFARSARLEQRSDQLGILRETVDADVMSGDQLNAWMGIINDLRLVLGTMLDVTEDDEPESRNDEQAASFELYNHLSWVLTHLVDALTRSLPDVPDEGLDDEPEINP
jgi:hypothetical protein